MNKPLPNAEQIIPQIRPLSLSDIDTIYELGSNASEFAVSAESSFWEKEELERWITENRDDVLLIAEVNGQIAGFALAKYHGPTRVGTLIDTFTSERFRRKRIATALEKETIKQLKEKGATYIYGLVKEDNTASIQLQKSLGFTQGEKMIWMELVPKD